MQFTYFAKKASGEEKKDTIEAESCQEVSNIMRSQEYTVISCDEVSGKGTKSDFFAFSFASFKKISISDKIHLSKNLSAMITAGLSLAKSLDILGRQTRNEKLKAVLDSVGNSIKKGNSLSESFKLHPKVFPPLFTAMTKVGEETGNLSNSLEIISKQMDRDYALRRKVKGAMTYPSVIMGAMGIIGILMFTYVVPTLVATFKDMELELPTSTKAIIAVSDFMSNNTIAFFSILTITIIALVMGFKSKPGKRLIDKVSLHIPVISLLVKKVNSARTARTLSSLIGAGLDVLEAIDITQEVLQNHLYKEVLEQTKIDVQKGIPISESFKNAEHLYPIQVGEMMAVGEETGKLADMLNNLAIFYEAEVDETTKNMSTIIEPFLMVIIGVAVGFFAISMIKPMYSMMEGV